MNEQLELSTYIKSVHKKLRREAKLLGHEEAWRSHMTDRTTLSKYAAAMKSLACEHWSKNELKENSKVTPRNEWIHKNCLQYFQEGLLYQRQREIDIATRNGLNADVFEGLSNPDLSVKLRVLDVGSCYNPLRVYEDFEVLPIDIAPASEEVFRCDFLNLEVKVNAESIIETNVEIKTNAEIKTGLKMDKNLKNIITTNLKNIDKEFISQVEDENAMNSGNDNINTSGEINSNKSDFYKNNKRKNENHGEVEIKQKERKTELNEEIKTDNKMTEVNEEIKTDANETFIKINNNKTIKQLKKSSFDIITFCLLLEYLPNASQRLLCCKKAYELLKPEGLLVILTPDSKHVGKNAAFMKSWRFALAKIGFSRIKYEKMTYLHCMLFRKSKNPAVAKRWAEIENNKPAYDGIYIPQDFNCDNIEKINEKSSDANCNDDDENIHVVK